MKTGPFPPPDPRLIFELRQILSDPKLEPEDLLKNVELAKRLLALDQQLAKDYWANGCQNPKCTATDPKLYSGDFERSTRGCAPEVKQYYEWRFSRNCSVCDKRVTPPSVRFLGSTWRISLVLVLTTARGVRSVTWLARHLDVPERTVKRWRRWWQKSFVTTTFWALHRADFAPSVDEAQLPGSVLVRHRALDVVEKLVDFLKFLSPLRPRERIPEAT
jgi:hypothetical protein